MRIQVISDIHLEFSGMERELNPVACNSRDLLIVAGDLCEGTNGFDWLGEQLEYSPVVFVTGNHEYYGHDIDDVDALYREFEHQNPGFYFLQKNTVDINGIRIAGCTFWTDFTDVDGWHKQQMRRAMTDFAGAITKRQTLLTPDISAGINYDHRMWLKQQKDIDIVVTHHAPTTQSITDYWREHGKLLNPAFAANADAIIEELAPAYWIHGHMHSYLRYWHNDAVDGTQILCNPVGYGGSYQERSGWSDDLIITIGETEGKPHGFMKRG